MATLIEAAHGAGIFRRTIEKAIAELREELFGSYRPERHYMRGPGPKCQERAHHETVSH